MIDGEDVIILGALVDAAGDPYVAEEKARARHKHVLAVDPGFLENLH